MKIAVWAALLCAAGLSSAVAGTVADSRAEELALAQPRLRRQMEGLRSEIGAVVDMTRRDELLSLLEHPVFQVLNRRRFDEWAVLARLKHERLLEDGVKTLLPKEPPMAFAAAPANVWRGPRSYPGGLVDQTLSDLKARLALSHAAYETYGLKLDEDLLRSTAVMQGAAKMATLHWKDNGGLPSSEPEIAAAPLSRVLGVAEALSRGWPPRWVVALAGADIKVLKSAAILADATYDKAGLTSTGHALAKPAPIESFIISQNSGALSLPDAAQAAVERSLPATQATGSGVPDYWTRDQALARDGDLVLYSRLTAK